MRPRPLSLMDLALLTTLVACGDASPAPGPVPTADAGADAGTDAAVTWPVPFPEGGALLPSAAIGSPDSCDVCVH